MSQRAKEQSGATFSVGGVVSRLRQHAKPGQLKDMARFGLTGEKRLGTSIPVIRRIAREIGTNHALAMGLWRTDIPEGAILAGLTADPARLAPRQLDVMMRRVQTWDVCDQTCLNLLVRSPHAWSRVVAWSSSDREFTRRAAFALLACLAVHDTTSPDARFKRSLRLIAEAAADDRNYVKKAVSWALRQIGKRNLVLHEEAIQTAQKLRMRSERSARWIASDALKELASPAIRRRIRSRSGGVRRA